MNTETTSPTSTAVQNGDEHPATLIQARAPAKLPSSPGSEAVDAILWRLQARERASRTLVVGVTGCGAGAGTSTLAANLALRAGLQGCRTLLVSCGSQSRKRRGAVEPGLWDILSGDTSPRECRPAEIAENVFSLSGGKVAGGAARVNSQLVDAMLDEFRMQYDAVIVDLPPAEDLGSALPLAKQLPGVLLVVRSEKTRQPDAQRALERLAEDGVPVSGTVLNQYRNHVPRWLRRWF